MYDLDPEFALGLLFVLKNVIKCCMCNSRDLLILAIQHVLQQNIFFSNFHMIKINSGFAPIILSLKYYQNLITISRLLNKKPILHNSIEK